MQHFPRVKGRSHRTHSELCFNSWSVHMLQMDIFGHCITVSIAIASSNMLNVTVRHGHIKKLQTLISCFSVKLLRNSVYCEKRNIKYL